MFEHKVEWVTRNWQDTNGWERLTEVLADSGRDGWELVTVNERHIGNVQIRGSLATEYTLYFKRAAG